MGESDNMEHAVQVYEILQRWEANAGPLLDIMLLSRKDAEFFADNPDPGIRGVAWELLSKHWPAARESEVLYARTALADAEPEIRRMALVCLIKRYANSNDKNACAVAALMALDPKIPKPTRGMAYLGLCLIGGIDFRDDLTADIMQMTDTFPSDLDWEWVKRCAAAYAK